MNDTAILAPETYHEAEIGGRVLWVETSEKIAGVKGRANGRNFVRPLRLSPTEAILLGILLRERKRVATRGVAGPLTLRSEFFGRPGRNNPWPTDPEDALGRVRSELNSKLAKLEFKVAKERQNFEQDGNVFRIVPLAHDRAEP